MVYTIKLNDGREIPAIGYGAGTQWHMSSNPNEV